MDKMNISVWITLKLSYFHIMQIYNALDISIIYCQWNMCKENKTVYTVKK